MKQTAVEWLVEQFTHASIVHIEEWQSEIQKALEMEKEQIVDAWQLSSPYSTRDDGKQYYTETYGPLPDDRGETRQNP